MPFALMKPYVGGPLADRRLATMLRATSARVVPGGMGPWTGRSPKVRASFVFAGGTAAGAGDGAGAAADTDASTISAEARRVGGTVESNPRRSGGPAPARQNRKRAPISTRRPGTASTARPKS